MEEKNGEEGAEEQEEEEEMKEKETGDSKRETIKKKR